MTTTELVASLREMANTLERENPACGRVRMDLYVHGIDDRASLAAWARTMTNSRAEMSGSNSVLRGEIGHGQVVVFYKTGLLGPLKRVEVQVHETKPDLAGLLAEFAPQEAASA